MRKLCLLLLFCIVLFKSNSQVGSLDHTFGNNGTQTTAFFTDTNTSSEQGRVVLISTNGDIFVVAEQFYFPGYTRIVKYLPDGRLDSSYGNGGYSNTANLRVTSAVMQGDKIIVTGSIPNLGIPDDIGLARYNPDGSLDISFGENGIVKTDFSDYQAKAVTLQGNKIIVGGYNDNFQFFLARYTVKGILDSSFGKNGSTSTDFNSSGSFINAIIIQGNKIVAAGGASNAVTFNYDFALARYTADGKLDSSFGKKGKVTTDFKNSDDQATSMTLQGNNILVAGYTTDIFGLNDFALARYNADGKLDSSFGKKGKVTTDFNNSFYDYAYSITLQGNKILLAGETLGDIALARYTTNGDLDSAFGKNGEVITDFNGNDDHAYSIALQGDKIIVCGATFYFGINGFPSDIALVRYKANGKLDASFGKNGKLTGHFLITRTFFTTAAIQGTKIVAAGYTAANDFMSNFILARYNHNGILDSSFGLNGKVITNVDNSEQRAGSIALQGDKIIMGGYTGNEFNGFNFILLRYTANGILDSSFGKNGIVTTKFINNFDRLNSIAMQGNEILVSGSVFNQNNFTSDFALARYTANGKIDNSFGQNGIVTTDFYNSYDQATSIVLQNDKIIVGGNVGIGISDFALARYTADGKLDASFGQNGKVTTDLNNSDDQATSIALEGNKIILAGTSVDIFQKSSFVLVRYTANGMLDVSFGENGIVTTDFVSSYGHTNSIAAQGDKIILGGNIGNSDFSFARYTANGTLDPSFGENGKVTTNLIGSTALGQIVVHENRLYAVGSLNFGPDEIYGVIAAYHLEIPEPSISITDLTVSESQKLAEVTVHLSAPATQAVWIRFTTRDKTAMHFQDYISVSYPLLITPGFTTSKIFIPIIDDNKTESTEQFEIVLTNATHATIRDSTGVVAILDDDALTAKQGDTLRINASPNPFASAITIQLQGGNNKQPASVRLYNVNSRLIEERKNISVGQSLQLGDQYKAGTYIIEAVQGTQRVQIKVIKSGK